MEKSRVLDFISRGRTDFIIELMKMPHWKEILTEGHIKPLQWLVYYNDVTGLKHVIENGGSISVKLALTSIEGTNYNFY